MVPSKKLMYQNIVREAWIYKGGDKKFKGKIIRRGIDRAPIVYERGESTPSGELYTYPRGVTG